MTHLEQLISRYLDLELTAQEETDLQHLLDTSAEARQILRQMEDLRGVARRLPGLSQPSPALENTLFQQLFAEESEEHRRAVPLPSSNTGLAGISRRISRALVPAVVALIAAGAGLWALLADGQSAESPRAAAVSDAVQHTPGTEPLVAGILPVQPQQRSEATEEEHPSASAAHERQTGRNRVSTAAAQPVVNSRNSGRSALQNTPENAEPTAAPETNGNTSVTTDSGIQSNAQWPPSTLLAYTEETPVKNITVDQDKAQTEEQNALQTPSVLHHPRRNEKNVVTASYRHGLAYVQGGRQELSGQDFNIRVEGHFHDRHRLSLAIGQSPLLIERTTTTLPTGVAVDPDEKSPRTASEQVEHSSRLSDEVWAGIGYGFAVISTGSFRVEPGLNFGVGEESIRYGAELPIRYRLNDRFSIDVIASLSRVEPHDVAPQDVERAYNQPFFLHVDEDERPSFTTIGAHIGLSLDIGR